MCSVLVQHDRTAGGRGHCFQMGRGMDARQFLACGGSRETPLELPCRSID